MFYRWCIFCIDCIFYFVFLTTPISNNIGIGLGYPFIIVINEIWNKKNALFALLLFTNQIVSVYNFISVYIFIFNVWMYICVNNIIIIWCE